MDQQLAAAARDEAALSMHVLRYLACRDGANLAVSPLSLHAALALLGAGARGATLAQIIAFHGPAGGAAHARLASHVALRVLADSGGSDGGPVVRFANGVWVDAALPLNAGYARVVAEHYRAEVRSAPFEAMPEEARRQINHWIATVTAGRIKDILGPGSIKSPAAAVLANALYFKGAWSRTFDAWLTRDDTFYLPTGDRVLVPFMSSTGDQYIVRRHGYKVLRLPYARGREDRMFSMYIYLPDDYHGLPGLLHRLSSDPALLERGGTPAMEVRVGMFMVPKFTVSYRTTAAGMLKDFGLSLPFQGSLADFSNMVESPEVHDPLFVSEVYHECFVEVNEGGTEAAAATVVFMVPTAAPPESNGAGGLRRRPPVHVPDQGGLERRGGFRRTSDQPFAFTLNFSVEGCI
ncbi:hypothetical protein ACP70R_036719 [Stipagrostis hirtigluma subsp. patula]